MIDDRQPGVTIGSRGETIGTKPPFIPHPLPLGWEPVPTAVCGRGRQEATGNHIPPGPVASPLPPRRGHSPTQAPPLAPDGAGPGRS
ncbi:hypothetical protein GCM10007079_34960 [Nocardiopsis terrae]|nr:hypothetical protein GCM10007079_34960 [Nocardiopsis terrae]